MEEKLCTSSEANKLHQGDRTSKSRESTVCRGGKDCCVPQCKNNSRRNPELSFHKIPKDRTLKKKWVKLLKTKGLCNLGSNHKVCSADFPGGKKTYKNNIPTILAASTYQRSRRTLVIHDNILQNSSSDDEVTEYSNLELCPATLNEKSIEDAACDSDNIVDNLQKQIEALQSKNSSLQKKYDDDMKAMELCLFRMERIIGSDSDFRFYICILLLDFQTTPPLNPFSIIFHLHVITLYTVYQQHDL